MRTAINAVVFEIAVSKRDIEFPTYLSLQNSLKYKILKLMFLRDKCLKANKKRLFCR